VSVTLGGSGPTAGGIPSAERKLAWRVFNGAAWNNTRAERGVRCPTDLHGRLSC
jgi:hypothetical protein